MRDPTATAPAPPPMWAIHTDGSAMPNPGRMGLGAVLVAPDGTRHTISRPHPGTGCNNEAELLALIDALAWARQQGAHAVTVHTDSRVITDQLGNPRAPALVRIHGLVEQARLALAGFAAHDLRWIPRHRNAEADALARAALGMPPKLQAPHPAKHKAKSKAKRRRHT